MKKILSIIPYKSQEDSDARMYPGDCGAACVAMILAGFGKNVSTNSLFQSTGVAPNEYLSRSNLITAAQPHGITLQRFNGWGFNNIIQSIDTGHPLIALVNYGAWSDPNSGVPTQSSFKGPHFVVVLGYDNNNVIIHDPLYWGSRRNEGDKKIMSFPQLNLAWSTAHTYKNNPDNAGLYCTNVLPVTTAPEPTQPAAPDKQTICRIKAWAAYNYKSIQSLPTNLENPLVANAYLAAMGDWGTRWVEHRVLRGDDLGLIALRYYGDPLKWKVITLFNDLPPIDAFQIGNLLKIPEPDFNG